MKKEDYPQKAVPETAAYPALTLTFLAGILIGTGRKQLAAIGLILLAAALFITVYLGEKRE